MTRRRLDIHVDAADEIEAAAAWYSLKSKAAAQQFLEELDAALTAIMDAPERWPNHRHGTRRYLLRRFPYLLVYRVTQDCIEIVACAHGRRRPGYWRDRTSTSPSRD